MLLKRPLQAYTVLVTIKYLEHIKKYFCIILVIANINNKSNNKVMILMTQQLFNRGFENDQVEF